MTATPVVPAWRHQAAGREFVHRLWGTGQRGAMLAIVMGGGKTKLAIDLINDLEAPFPLIVCPMRVVEVWRQQFERYSAAHYEFAALDDRFAGVRDKWAHARDMRAWAIARKQKLVTAINYESARVEPFASWALKISWPVVVGDELHKIKDGNGRTARWMAKLGRCARYRLGLTGTPMPHAPLDVWGQFRFLDPSILDITFGSFKLRHAVMGGYKNKEIVGWRDLDELYANFRKIAFQVGEEALDLPEAIDETFETDFLNDGRRIYAEMENEMVARVKDGTITAANALVKLLRLAQITGGAAPSESGDYYQIDHAKESLLEDLLDDLREPIVVFCRFRSDLEAVHRAARGAGHGSFELSGKRDDLKEWQKGAKDASVLAVQIQAGGVGVDLTRARVAIYYSIGYSLADYLQSRARIYRPPQTKSCLFIHLQVRNSIDECVLRAVRARRDLIDSVLNEFKKRAEPCLQ